MPRARNWIAGIVMASLAGCTVFSGWSDLQEGGGADAGRDSGKGDGSTTTDGSIKTDGSPEDDGAIGDIPSVPCGSATCTLGSGCCFIAGSGQSCTTEENCTGGTFFGCVDRRSCVRFLGAGFVCCFRSAQPRVSDCDLGPCQAGHVELCDPTAALPCSSGQCTIDFGINGVKACQ